MFKPTSFLTFYIFLGWISLAAAAPLDAPGTVYIDGLPCNTACQNYMAWSRQVSGQRHENRPQPVAAQPSIAAKPYHVKKSASPKSTPARLATLPNPKRAAEADKPAGKVEVKPAPPVASTSVPSPPPDPRIERESEMPRPAQVATVPPAQEPPAAPPVPPPTSEAAPPAAAAAELPSDAKPATETNTAALSTEKEEPTIAILLVREDIKSLADLSNKKVAIDASQADEVPDIKTAISKAGATGVEISEGTKFALGRVMDGEVPAGIIMLASPEGAAQWTGVPGYTILKLPLARAKGSPG